LNGSVTWRQQVLGVIFVNLATLCWATNAVLGRWLRDDIGPLALTTLRFTAATAFFGILLRNRPAQERRYGKDKWWILVIGPGTAGSRPWEPAGRWCSITPCPFTALSWERPCLASL
jgi:threonine/homoserine efflux transporter RhtA